jgi:hypothetical protein
MVAPQAKVLSGEMHQLPIRSLSVFSSVERGSGCTKADGITTGADLIQWDTDIKESLQILSLKGSFNWTKAADTNSTEGSTQRATEIDESGLLQFFFW